MLTIYSINHGDVKKKERLNLFDSKEFTIVGLVKFRKGGGSRNVLVSG
jgi:hypothetical protein